MENVKPYNYSDINFMELIRSEIYYEVHGFYHESMIEPLLNYYVYYIREHILMDGENIINNSFTGRCGLATDLGIELAIKYGFKCYPFNIGDVLNVRHIHKTFFISVPLKTGNKLFLIDPTFKQFCKPESFGVGYVLDLADEELYQQILKNGYFELDLEDLKTYLDSFKLIYKNDNREISKEKYWKLIGENPDDSFKVSGKVVETPLDILNRVSLRQRKMDL